VLLYRPPLMVANLVTFYAFIVHHLAKSLAVADDSASLSCDCLKNSKIHV